jgi:hypothetical protein
MSLSVIQNVLCNYSAKSACTEVSIALIVEVGTSAFTFSLQLQEEIFPFNPTTIFYTPLLHMEEFLISVPHSPASIIKMLT